MQTEGASARTQDEIRKFMAELKEKTEQIDKERDDAIKKVRDETWIATEKDGDKEYAVNRTDALAFLGGGQNTNEECYLWTKMARLFGTNFLEHQARL